MKPMLASDWDEDKQRFPVIAQPKIDGVRGLNIVGKLTGRSLKPFKNRHVTALFSHSALLGLDGEFAAEHETHPDLCRLTSSALGTILGEPFVVWHLFDYVTSETRELPYYQRFKLLNERVGYIVARHPQFASRLRVFTSHECSAAAVLNHFDKTWLESGYEGTILRDPYGLHKSGRSTVKEGGLLRVKRFVDTEGVVVGVTEGETNQNEAKVNELGNTARSSHQANMVANGMVGTLTCAALEDIVVSGRVVIAKGDPITVSAGRMTAEERAMFLAHPERIIGQVAKFQFFPKGIKDKLRFATFQSLRMKEDML